MERNLVLKHKAKNPGKKSIMRWRGASLGYACSFNTKSCSGEPRHKFQNEQISTGFDNIVPANYNKVTKTQLGTSIANDQGTMVSTVEHLMAALWGCGIDNAVIEVDAAEIPIMDGSSEPFVFLIECAGVKDQAAG
jgi:UDP-3-O-acyl-N-acetylglucosamine deacetylase